MLSADLDCSTIKGTITQRILAHIIDVTIIVGLAIPFWFLISLVLPDFLNFTATGSFAFIIYILYLSILEGTRFTTIGKKIFGLYVLSLDLKPISLRQAFIRNVVRVADSFFLYLPILSKDGR
ncbi:MAG TPA: hypothetical protein EYP68_05330, partial [Candidatus Korarchaeota archaeon]|nr:hypothetical protein [Candidatus Korarchaeota archaeon]